MTKEELEYQLEKSQVEIASLKLRIKTIKRRRKQESAKRRLLQKRIDKAIELLEKTEIENSWFKQFKKKELSILRGEE